MLRRAVLVLLGCAPLGAFAAPVPKEDDAARMLRIYGVPHDPDKSAEFKPSGDTLHVILSKEKRLLSAGAPRVWREVRGDFTATVRVSFPIRADVPPKHAEQGKSRAGGGLVVWLDSDNFLTVTRDEQDFGNKPGEWFRGEFLITERGLSASTSAANRVESKPSGYVRVKRKGKALEASFSTDGKEWEELRAQDADWSDVLKVGVLAENGYKAPFEVVFSEYTLTLAK